MQHISELRFSATVGQEPEVELVLVQRVVNVPCLLDCVQVRGFSEA